MNRVENTGNYSCGPAENICSVPVLQIEHLYKSYGPIQAVNDLSITLNPGEFCGLIGPNGAGKSTLIRTILGFLQKDAGTIRLFGSKNLTPKRATVGYMAAVNVFPQGMKVKDVLETSAKLYGRDCTKKAEELCGKLELNMHKKIRELSLGNQKKVAVAAAFQHEPDFLILDEPTSGLDPLVQQTFYELLKAEHEKGTTILFSSHNLNEVQSLCQSVICINQGRILFQGSPSALQSRNMYRILLKTSHVFSASADLSTISKHISDLEIHQDQYSFLYHGPILELLKCILEHHIEITDLEIAHPSLEEIFTRSIAGDKKTGEKECQSF